MNENERECAVLVRHIFSRNEDVHYMNQYKWDRLARIRNQLLRIDVCAKFQLNWMKDKGTRILTWNNTKNGLITSYVPPSDDVSKLFIAIERLCPRIPA